MNKTPLSITISRPSYGDGRKLINITIRDEISRITFVDAEISYEKFTEALTGLGSCPMLGVMRGLQYVGMERITEPREIVCPLTTYDRKALSEWLEQNVQEEGWLVSTYLGSKRSVSNHESGGQLLRYSVTKYVQPTENPKLPLS